MPSRKDKGDKQADLQPSTSGKNPVDLSENPLYKGARYTPSAGPMNYWLRPSMIDALDNGMERLRGHWGLPDYITIVKPGPMDTVMKVPQGCLAVYKDAFDYGLRFPLHPFSVSLLEAYNLSVPELYPNSWGCINAFIVFCGLAKLEPSLTAFRYIFCLKPRKSIYGPGWVSFSHRIGYRLITGMKDNHKSFRYDFAYLYNSKGWDLKTVYEMSPRLELNFQVPQCTLEESVIIKYAEMSVTMGQRGAVTVQDEWTLPPALLRNELFLCACGISSKWECQVFAYNELCNKYEDVKMRLNLAELAAARKKAEVEAEVEAGGKLPPPPGGLQRKKKTTARPNTGPYASKDKARARPDAAVSPPPPPSAGSKRPRDDSSPSCTLDDGGDSEAYERDVSLPHVTRGALRARFRQAADVLVSQADTDYLTALPLRKQIAELKCYHAETLIRTQALLAQAESSAQLKDDLALLKVKFENEAARARNCNEMNMTLMKDNARLKQYLRTSLDQNKLLLAATKVKSRQLANKASIAKRWLDTAEGSAYVKKMETKCYIRGGKMNEEQFRLAFQQKFPKANWDDLRALAKSKDPEAVATLDPIFNAEDAAETTSSPDSDDDEWAHDIEKDLIGKILMTDFEEFEIANLDKRPPSPRAPPETSGAEGPSSIPDI